MIDGKSEGDAGRMRMMALSAVVASLALAGCITVKAPDKPIEINLNVKVQQEVIVRLQKDAQDLIQNNPELFPQ
jgi:outer membrane murein-binding lipoprotein Lpp